MEVCRIARVAVRCGAVGVDVVREVEVVVGRSLRTSRVDLEALLSR
jgi:hypothetical protein